MKIGIVAKHLDEQSGLGTYSRELVRGLADRDDVEVVVYVPRMPDYVLPVGVTVRVSRGGDGRMVEGRWASVTVPRLARRDGVDLLHYLWPTGHFGSSPPYVVTVHDALNYELRLYRQSPALELMLRRMVEGARLVLTVSETAKESIAQAYGLPPERIRPVLLGIHPRPPRRAGQRGEWWLFLGGIERRKNLAVVLDAWHLLPEPRDTLEVVGVLSPAERHYTRGELQGLGTPGVNRHGYVSEDRLEELFRGAIALLHPSRGEGFGLPVIEAMSMGIPVIAADASATPEVTGGAAVLVEPEPAPLAGAMQHLASPESAGLRFELSARGIARARELNWARTCRETVAAYRSALHGDPPS
jgi:glycosyltransferase involved in cell wall biosynthesis